MFYVKIFKSEKSGRLCCMLLFRSYGFDVFRTYIQASEACSMLGCQLSDLSVGEYEVLKEDHK